MNILVVEDELLQAFVLMDWLEGGGHTPVGPAPDVNLALMLASRNRLDLAFVNLGLRNGQSGADLARDLHDRFAVPVIFVTAQIEVAREKRGAAIACVRKPVTSDAVSAAIAIVLGLGAGLAETNFSRGVEVYGPG